MSFSLSQLWVYPVKSLRGYAVNEVKLTATGAEHDRQWMVVSPDGDFRTQRKHPKMCLISTHIDAASDTPLTLGHADAGSVSAPRGGGYAISAKVWNDTVQAEDCGDEVAAWLTATLNIPCRLVFMPQGSERAVPESDATVGFADAYPLLLCNEASLNDFNQHLEADIGMNRFRPNVVVSGASAWAEDEWREIEAGETRLTINSPCTRCVMPSVDPDTGEKQPVVIDALNAHRRFGYETRFGQNASFDKNGYLRVGDPVTVLS